VDEEVRDPMTALLDDAPDPLAEVLAAHARLDQAKSEMRAASRRYMARWQAQVGHKVHLAREAGYRQKMVQMKLGLSREQVRLFERAYENWRAKHPDDDLYSEADWNALLQLAS
jgi:hypothetical protein